MIFSAINDPTFSLKTFSLDFEIGAINAAIELFDCTIIGFIFNQ